MSKQISVRVLVHSSREMPLWVARNTLRVEEVEKRLVSPSKRGASVYAGFELELAGAER